MHEFFHRVASRISNWVGSPFAFILAIFIIGIWITSGPFFGFSDTWQLVINTGTTIVTFLMVFLIQNTQNRDAKAIHLKLDGLVQGMKGGNELVDIEDISDEELEKLHERFKKIHDKYNSELEKRSIRKKEKNSQS